MCKHSTCGVDIRRRHEPPSGMARQVEWNGGEESDTGNLIKKVILPRSAHLSLSTASPAVVVVQADAVPLPSCLHNLRLCLPVGR